jgi:predicted nucleic acid-binding protein
MIYVLDSSAIIAYLRQEPGGASVRKILDTPEDACFVHAVNLCEVYYDAYRRDGEDAAGRIVDGFISIGIVVSEEFSAGFWRAAGKIKALQRRVSLADCCAIALAQSLGGTVLTCDHHEFDAIAAANVCAVSFIR